MFLVIMCAMSHFTASSRSVSCSCSATCDQCRSNTSYVPLTRLANTEYTTRGHCAYVHTHAHTHSNYATIHSCMKTSTACVLTPSDPNLPPLLSSSPLHPPLPTCAARPLMTSLVLLATLFTTRCLCILSFLVQHFLHCCSLSCSLSR